MFLNKPLSPFFKNSLSAIMMPVNISFIFFSLFEASASSLIAIGLSSSSLMIRPYHLGSVTFEVRMDNFFLLEDLISFLSDLTLTSGTSAYSTKVFPVSGKYGAACFTACPVPNLSFCSQKTKSPGLLDRTYFLTSSFLYPVTRTIRSGFRILAVSNEYCING